MVGKKGLFELKKCTVSGLKRQFDKWHLFSAPTCMFLPDPENYSVEALSGKAPKASCKSFGQESQRDFEHSSCAGKH